MAVVTPDVFTVITSYGGQKKAYIEVNSATAADVIDLAAESVSGLKHMDLRNDSDGSFVAGTASGKDQVVIGSGPSNNKVTGEVSWRGY